MMQFNKETEGKSLLNVISIQIDLLCIMSLFPKVL